MRRLFLPLAAVAIGIVACATLAIHTLHHGRDTSLGTSDDPVVLVLSKEHGRGLGAEDLHALEDALSKDSHLAVQVRVSDSPSAAVESFQSDADVGLLNVFGYLLANHEFGVEAALQALRKEGACSYVGVILVRKDGPRTLAELNGREVAFVDAYSDSGFIFPTKVLADAGVRVKAVFCGSHPAVLDRLRKGLVAAAATWRGADEGDPTLRVLASTDEIPNEPVFFRRGVDPHKREAVMQAILRLSSTPQGRRILREVADITGFVPVTDEAYRPVRQAIKAAGKTVYDVVPGGWGVEAGRRERKDLVPW